MRHGAQQAAVNQSTNDNYKILVVDDEEGILDSLSIFLKRSGYQFVGITDPVEAIERVKQEHFDLLVLDFIMTPLHGDQVVEEIRKFVYITINRSQRFSPTIRNNQKARYTRLLWKKW